MLSKFYSVLIGIVIALTLLGLVVAGVTRVRMGRQAVAPVATDQNMPAANDADTGIAVKAPAAPKLAPENGHYSVLIDETNFKFTPSVIHVTKGDQVTLTLKTDEGVHNLFLSGYDIRTDAKKTGQTATLDFTADKTGTFDFWCEVGSHKVLGMTGKLIVEEGPGAEFGNMPGE